MTASAPPAHHLVHGMGMAWEEPDWPAITPDEAEGILRHFPAAGSLAEIEWHSPRPFSAATTLHTDRGSFFLKRHHSALRPVAALLEEHAFMAHLRANGVPVPDVLETADGASAISQGAWTYELHRRAPGLDLYRERRSWTPFLSLDHAREAGVALARLHLAARGFDAPGRAAWPLVSSMTILPSRDPMAAMEDYVAARPAVAAYLSDKPWRQEAAALFGALGDGLADRLATQPSLWTHNDWHPTNQLWTGHGSVSAVIDFGLSTRTCALHDLATAIERSCFPWLEAGYGDGDVDAALALVEGYRTLSPLGDEDTETLIRLLPLVHVEFALTEVDYFFGLLKDRHQADLAWHGYFIGHADWFRSRTGTDFLCQFEYRARA